MDEVNNVNPKTDSGANQQPSKSPGIVETLISPFPEATEARLKFIGKFDWKIALPLGIIITVYEVVIKGHYPSVLGYIGMVCLTIGLVNLGAKLFLKK